MELKVVLIVLWVIISLLEGRRDGFMYNYKTNSFKSDNYNIHWIFFSERTIILGLITGLHLLFYSWYNTALFSTSLALIFSFGHNGMYYTTRNFLDSKTYPQKWFDSSTTSTSAIELGPVSRTILAIIGFVGIIITFNF